ncbi:MAG TPA: type II CAAX endopeptidase family protein [Thermoanaerobaculia bacterium]|jgi:hypothetical protein
MEPPIASRKHTLIVTAIFVLIAAAGFLNSRHVAAAASASSRLPFYLSAIVLQWLLLRYLVFGVRRAGFSLLRVAGLTGRTPRALALDVLLGGAVFFALRLLLRFVASALGGYDDHAAAILPRGRLESLVWIAVAITAGICEELTFRGYLQEQYARLSGSRLAGAAAQAVLFGLSHGYQGWKPCVVITTFGLGAAGVTLARRSVLPMIVAHAVTDLVSGLTRAS